MNLIIAQGEREIVRIKKFLDLPKKIITDHNKEFIIKLLKKKFKEYKRKEIFEGKIMMTYWIILNKSEE